MSQRPPNLMQARNQLQLALVWMRDDNRTHLSRDADVFIQPPFGREVFTLGKNPSKSLLMVLIGEYNDDDPQRP
jgi:hypothetical protein